MYVKAKTKWKLGEKMKLKSGYILHEVAGEYLVLPADGADLSSMLNLNETGAFLWRQLEQETDEQSICTALTDEYDVDAQTAETHVHQFIAQLKELKLLA